MNLPMTKNQHERIALIVNPRSGGGRTAKKLARIQTLADQWFERWEVFVTEGPRHAEKLASEAKDKGFDIVASVGGDGTASEVINGLIPQWTEEPSGVVFTVIPAGTGSDLIKTIGIPTDMELALQVAAHGETRLSDVYDIEMTDELTGDSLRRSCINMAGFCSNGDVVARVNRGSKRLGGRLTFLKASLETALFYKAPVVKVRWIDTHGESGEMQAPILSAFLANGQYGGGGMWIGPASSMQDGLMTCLIIPPLNPLGLLSSVRKFYQGTVGTIEGAIEKQIISLCADSDSEDPVRIDVDGEQPGILPAKFRVMPKVQAVRGLW